MPSSDILILVARTGWICVSPEIRRLARIVGATSFGFGISSLRIPSSPCTAGIKHPSGPSPSPSPSPEPVPVPSPLPSLVDGPTSTVVSFTASTSGSIGLGTGCTSTRTIRFGVFRASCCGGRAAGLPPGIEGTSTPRVPSGARAGSRSLELPDAGDVHRDHERDVQPDRDRDERRAAWTGHEQANLVRRIPIYVACSQSLTGVAFAPRPLSQVVTGCARRFLVIGP